MDGIKLTEKAAKKFREIIEGTNKANAAVRVDVVPAGGGCSGLDYEIMLDSDPPRQIDHKLDFSGVKVYVDKESMVRLNGTTIDYVEDEKGTGFVFKNPNAESRCGCGESFHK